MPRQSENLNSHSHVGPITKCPCLFFPSSCWRQYDVLDTRGTAEPGLILDLRTRTLGSSPVSASERSYPSLLPPVGLSFPICKMQEWNSLISRIPSSSSSPCQIISQMPIHSAYWPLPTCVSLAAGHSRSQVSETSLSLWKPERFGSWGYFSIAANLHGQPQMSALIRDPSSRCF